MTTDTRPQPTNAAILAEIRSLYNDFTERMLLIENRLNELAAEVRSHTH